MKPLLEFSERFGELLSRMPLTALYFLVLGPFALVYQRFADPPAPAQGLPRATG
ncbi:MAG: hypothetical protein R3E96_13770 [Planctomycetota bacterium]